MKPKAVIITGFVLAISIVLFFAMRGKKSAPTEPAAGGSGTTDPRKAPDPDTKPPPRGATVEITMLYSTEKKEWVEAARVGFEKEHPEIKLKLVGKGSLDAVAAILDGKEKPTLWSPADSLALGLLASDWRTKYDADLFATTGDDAPAPLVITPLVFVIWEDRAKVLMKAGGSITWDVIHKAVVSNRGWAAIGGDPEWGLVKLGHTDPTRSNSGIQALLLMTLEYFKNPPRLKVSDLSDAGYLKWMAEIERGVTRFETSTGTFMTDMIRFGPSKYEIAVVYENLAISQLPNAQGRYGSLKVYYPSVTLWSDHPIALMQGDWVTDAQKDAARVWMTYLKSRPVQERALHFGFRPADTSVPLKTEDPNNPFTKYAEHGIRLDLPQVAPNPDPAVVRNLMLLWQRTIGGNR